MLCLSYASIFVINNVTAFQALKRFQTNKAVLTLTLNDKKAVTIITTKILSEINKNND